MLLAAHESRREILGYQSRFMLPTVAPGQDSGGAPYRQPCPAYPSADCLRLNSGASAALVIGRKAAQERFSEENFRLLNYLNSPETYFSKALPQVCTQLCELAAHSKPG